MKIVVISDTHGRYRALYSPILLHDKADAYIHLGDGEEEVKRLLREFPDIADRFHCVRGNCDHSSELPETKIIDIAHGHRIFATHGHRYAVNYTVDVLLASARENNCDIALFGHTHTRYANYVNGLYVLNPGSASRPRDGWAPSYALIDVTSAGIVTNHVNVTL